MNQPPSRKRNLVIVRAGENSLHPGWLSSPYDERTFDLVISYFSKTAFDAHTKLDGVTRVLHVGGKWDGLHKTLTGMDWEDYDYIWLPDDDIETDGSVIDTMFQMASDHGLAVCQPSLSRQSYFTHFIFSQCHAFRLRYTNHIEIMVPCLSKAMLHRVLPMFETTMSGFGLDYIWCRLAESGAFRAAILDTVSVFHTRPIGSTLKKTIATTGTTSQDEEAILKETFGVAQRVVPIAYAGVDADGSPVTGRGSMANAMALSWKKDLRDFRDPSEALWKVLQIYKRQFIKTLDMSLL